MTQDISGRKLGLLFAAAALVMTFALISCGDDENPVTPTDPGDPVLRQITALPTTTTWEKIWGDPAAGIAPLLVGEYGMVFRQNGMVWDSLNSGADIQNVLHSVWGTAANDLRVVGRVTDRSETIIDTTDDGTPFTYESPLADLPILKQYNGIDFDAEPVTDIEWGLYDIWGTANDDIFAVGYNGTVIHRDATGWTKMIGGGESPVWLNSVWGTASDNVYAAGRNGALLHYDGAAWSIVTTRVDKHIWDVWGLDDSTIFCVGASGLALKYDGDQVTPMETGTTQALYSIWGTAEDNLYAVGWNGTVIHYDGAGWNEIEPLTEFGLISLWGTGPSDIWAVGETVLHYDGLTWEPVNVRHEPDFKDVWAGTASTGSEIVAVGTEGTIFTSFGNNFFGVATVDGGTIDTDLHGVGGAVDTAQFIVGAGGLILQRGASFNEWTTMTSAAMDDLHAVAALSSEYAIAVGAGGMVLQYNGVVWNQVATGLTTEDLNDVWIGEVGTDTVVHAVGESGTALYFDGSWSTEQGVTAMPLLSVTGLNNGDAYAVTGNGTVIKFTAAQAVWSVVDVGSMENFRAIWSDASDRVFIAAEGGQVFQMVNGSLNMIESGVGIDLNGISGFNATDFIVVGDANHILRYSL